MNTNLNTDQSLEKTIEPPKSSLGVFGWLKKNLFSNWYNSILTIISVIALFYIVKGVFSFVFISAQWSVISENYRLFMVGQYTKAEIWRVWSCLGVVSLLFGLSAGIWKGTARHMSVLLSVILLIHMLVPFTSGTAKMWLGINIGIVVFGYFLAPFIPKNKIITIAGWFLSFPFTIFLLNGFGVFSTVKTNVWGGLLLTLLISVVAIVVSFPIGILLALGRTSNLPIVKYFCIAYIEIIRGVPLITVFFMAQLMIPLFLPEGLEINNVLRVMIGATLFTAAYMAENVRGGLQSIPSGQFEAAKAIGLNGPQAMTFIIMPQALRAIIPAIVGQSISMFKDTSLVAIVGLIDLLGIAQTVISNPDFLGRQMEVYMYIALLYWVIAYSMSYASRRMEKSLGVGER
ncbi:amino acid ABC transporter permease [Aquibacillus albus]|uniref:General L-amino acid transport system permease protein n=1 Tax=Aquibacillus albus TaxID=1168171 RepID=A0ABS2N243_9BACI|nr:amino acid ABC transporter permease [Aquibacillus albus]MBM7572163.1 general L-amino acid transport system permease protein [Aquibacillus albus]